MSVKIDPVARVDVLRKFALPENMMETYRMERARGSTEEQAIGVVVATGMAAAEASIVVMLRENHWPHAAWWIETRIAEEMAILGRGDL